MYFCPGRELLSLTKGVTLNFVAWSWCSTWSWAEKVFSSRTHRPPLAACRCIPLTTGQIACFFPKVPKYGDYCRTRPPTQSLPPLLVLPLTQEFLKWFPRGVTLVCLQSSSFWLAREVNLPASFWLYDGRKLIKLWFAVVSNWANWLSVLSTVPILALFFDVPALLVTNRQNDTSILSNHHYTWRLLLSFTRRSHLAAAQTKHFPVQITVYNSASTYIFFFKAELL